MNKLYLIIIILFSNFSLYSQETLKPLGENVQLKGISMPEHTYKTYSTSDALLSLPFFDDFSKPGPYPDQSLWEGYSVYVNYTYGVNPPTIGVATFDAMDSVGILYADTSVYKTTDTITKFDRLMSRPINLNSSMSNVVLSFYYQPQGLGEAPEQDDWLNLDFYSPNTRQWDTIWHARGDSLRAFKRVAITIDAKYLLPGFRFKFWNTTSINDPYNDPGRNTNGDIWNIDYVYLNANRNADDTTMLDVAITQPITSMLKDYESMPWSHFTQLQSTLHERRDTILFSIHNFSSETKNIEHGYHVRDSVNHTSTSYGVGTNPVYAGTTFVAVNDIEKPDDLSATDSGLFKIQSYIKTPDIGAFKWNDQFSYMQKFTNYYAYDDGSAEYGYGFVGEGTESAQLAYQFKNYMNKDTLWGVLMFFNWSINSQGVTQEPSFILTAWDNQGNQPGQVLQLNDIVSQRKYVNSINGFSFYPFETPVVVSDTFYVGWEQIDNYFLNVGYDRNNERNNHIFYNLGGTWFQSKLKQKGSLMIRPVIGTSKEVKGILKVTTQTEPSWKVYPIPAQNNINIEPPENFQYGCIVKIFDCQGRLALNENFSTNVSLHGLIPGIYILRIEQKNQSVYQTRIVKLP